MADDVVTVVRALARSVRARATRAVRHVFARNPNCRMRTKAARQHVLDEAPGNSIAVTVMVRRCAVLRVVLPAKGDVLTVKRDQPVITDRHPMRIAGEIPQDSGGPTESGFRVHDPVGAKERVDEERASATAWRSVVVAPPRSGSPRVYARRRPLMNLPRKRGSGP